MTAGDFFEALDSIENAKYNLDYTHSFKRGVKTCSKSNLDLSLLLEAITSLVQNGYLAQIYHPHPLKGFPRRQNRKIMECHISAGVRVLRSWGICATFAGK
jgi:mRNA-degrading endonuclease YafQ of YafQ-DinJ toxin-antitoxin module